MNNISVCIIAKNEEDYISQCIESVYDIANEIIVLDTGSTDKTKEIVSSFEKVNLFETIWENDNAKARNLCISYAFGDWILILDADEILSKESILRLKPFLESNNFDNSTILRFKTINQNPFSMFANYFKSTMFKRNSEIRYIKPIHDFPYAEKIKINYVNCHGLDIYHYNGTTKKDLQIKALNYIDRLNKEIIKSSIDEDICYYTRHLGDSYFVLEDYNKALLNYQKAYNLANKTQNRYVISSLDIRIKHLTGAKN